MCECTLCICEHIQNVNNECCCANKAMCALECAICAMLSASDSDTAPCVGCKLQNDVGAVSGHEVVSVE